MDSLTHGEWLILAGTAFLYRSAQAAALAVVVGVVCGVLLPSLAILAGLRRGFLGCGAGLLVDLTLRATPVGPASTVVATLVAALVTFVLCLRRSAMVHKESCGEPP